MGGRGVTWGPSQWPTACLLVNAGTPRTPTGTPTTDRTSPTGDCRTISAGQQRTPPDLGVTRRTRTNDGSTVTSTTAVSRDVRTTSCQYNISKSNRAQQKVTMKTTSTTAVSGGGVWTTRGHYTVNNITKQYNVLFQHLHLKLQ